MARIRGKSSTEAVFYNWDGASSGILKGLDKTFFGAYGGVTLPRGSLCWAAGLAAQEYDFGDWSAHEITDVVNSRCIILWGTTQPTPRSIRRRS
jgi:anaerobic selenocysteine-containing dehydrogenase